MLTSQVRIEALGVAHCNKIGTSIPGRGELRAAIYQDGSTFGQQRWIDALLERRRRQIAEIDTAIRFLQAGADGAPSAESLAARFEATNTASQAKDAVSVPRVFDIREFVLKSLRGQDRRRSLRRSGAWSDCRNSCSTPNRPSLRSHRSAIRRSPAPATG